MKSFACILYRALACLLLSFAWMSPRYAQAMIASGDPPRLDMPAKGAVIKESPLTNILFSWTPRHLNSLASAYGTEYEFSMVELYDKQTPAEGAFQYAWPFFSETLRPASFIYNAAHPLLVPGRRYAWRVRAVARDGMQQEMTVFKNNGYSEVFYFDYAADCQPVQMLGAIIEKRRVNITWMETGALEYTVEYRKKGSSRWYTAGDVKPGQAYLFNLQFGREYEYRVGCRCVLNDVFAYSAVKSFRMPDREEKSPQCGIMPESRITNRTPADALVKGLPFMAGDFLVFVTRASGSGVFSGEGYVGIPYLNNAQVAVTFSNIVVNTDGQLVSGFVETKFDLVTNNLILDLDEKLKGGSGVGDIRTGEEQASFEVDYVINPDINVKPLATDDSEDGIKGGEGTNTFTKGENGKYQLVFTDDKNGEHILETDSFPFTIRDKNGDTFEVNDSGEIKPISSADSDIRLDEATKETPHPELAVLQFEKTLHTKYALDAYRDIYAKVTEYFLAYKPTTKDMIASAKFMHPGAGDEVFVRIAESHEGFDPDKVRFVTDKGREYKGVYNGKDGWTLPLAGSADNDGQALYAVHEQDGKYLTLARLNIFSYTKKNIRVKLIPVNNFKNGFRADEVLRRLNEIYNPVGINCDTVELAPSFSYDLGDGLHVTGSGFFSTETKDMKALQAAYLSANPDEKDLCLFIVPSVKGSEGIAGDMPRGKQFGYLFSGATSQTIAHEIGHGLFRLDHPFDRAYAARSFAQGDLADNLMEYSGGSNLVKLQWDIIHSPGLVIGLFERDDSGMAKEESTDILSSIIEKILSAGENGCGFIRKLTSSTPNKELNTSLETTTIDYLVGKIENGNVSFSIEAGTTKHVEISPQVITFIRESEKKELVLWVSNGDIQVCEAGEDYTLFASLPAAKDDPTFLSKYKTDLFSCKGKNLLEILRRLKSYTRNNQEIELSYENAVYTIKNDKLQPVDLSDDAINTGEWTDTDKDTRIRYYINESGIIQVKAFGYRKDIDTIPGKTADIVYLSSHIRNQTNRFLLDNRVTSFEQESPVFQDESEVFADGRYITIGNGNTGFFKIISEGIGLTTTLLKTARIEEDTYLDNPKTEVVIRIPGIGTGTIEAGVKIITDITEPVCMVYDLVVDKKARTEICTGLVEIKNQVKDDPSTLFPLLGEIILEETTGNTSEEWQELNRDDTDAGRQSHLLSKGAVRTVATVLVSGKLIAKLPDMADELAKKMGRISGKTAADYAEELAKFVKKTLAEKLEEIENIWKTKYPINEMLDGRTFFEDIMGEYRYMKSDGWAHTSDIAHNFKGVDFYKGVTQGENIYAETAVSMKTTITTDVNKWLISEPIQKNIGFLEEGWKNADGLVSNGKSMFITNAEVHIYMQKENITPELIIAWMNKLNTVSPKIKFEIKSIEDFIK